MLSGVGPAGHLRSHGIEVVADLPGVGSGLQDHQDATLIYRIHKLPNKAWRWQVLRAAEVNPFWKKRADPEAIKEGLTPLMIDFHSGFESQTPDEPDVHAMCTLGPFRDYNISPFHFNDSYFPLIARAYNQIKPLPYQGFLVELFRSQQATGSIRLESTDPTAPPLIDTHGGENEDGLTRLALGRVIN